jgi:hypothetical protein
MDNTQSLYIIFEYLPWQELKTISNVSSIIRRQVIKVLMARDKTNQYDKDIFRRCATCDEKCNSGTYQTCEYLGCSYIVHNVHDYFIFSRCGRCHALLCPAHIKCRCENNDCSATKNYCDDCFIQQRHNYDTCVRCNKQYCYHCTGWYDMPGIPDTLNPQICVMCRKALFRSPEFISLYDNFILPIEAPKK